MIALLYSRTERVWRYLTQSSHCQYSEPETTRPNDRRLLLDPRLDRECREQFSERTLGLEVHAANFLGAAAFGIAGTILYLRATRHERRRARENIKIDISRLRLK